MEMRFDLIKHSDELSVVDCIHRKYNVTVTDILKIRCFSILTFCTFWIHLFHDTYYNGVIVLAVFTCHICQRCQMSLGPHRHFLN